MAKEINHISIGENITHKGDLKINCDVPEGASITVIKGKLSIFGDIHKGSKIYIEDKKKQIQNLYTFHNLGYLNHSFEAESKSEDSPILKIYGSLMQGVTISSDVPVVIGGHIGDDSSITNTAMGMIARRIGKNVTIDVEKIIIVEDVGESSKISSRGSITAKNCANQVTLTCPLRIKVGQVGDNCHIKSQNGTISAKNIGEGNKIEAGSSVTVEDVGESSEISSKRNTITVSGDVLANVKLSAYGNIILKGTKAASAHMKSTSGSVIENQQPYINPPERNQYRDSDLEKALAMSLAEEEPVKKSNLVEGLSDLTYQEQLNRVIAISEREQGARFNNDEEKAPSVVRSPVVMFRQKVNEKEYITPAMQDYIKGFEGKEKNTKRFEDLGIDSSKIDIECPITLDVPDIPVYLNETIYDWNAILQLRVDPVSGMRTEPNTRYPFNLSEVMTARKVQGQIEMLINERQNHSEFNVNKIDRGDYRL